MNAQEAAREEMRSERAVVLDDIASNPQDDNEGKSDRVRALETHIEVSEHRTRQLQSEFDSLASSEGYADLESLFVQLQAHYQRLSKLDAEIAQNKINISRLLENRKELTEGLQLARSSLSRRRGTLKHLPGFSERHSKLVKKHSVEGYS
jgi:chromosome segregation ATPase